MKAGQPMIQWVEINRKAFLHNVGEFKRRLGRTELMAVVKANAYGHGLLEIASLAREAGLNWLGVNNVEEGLALRQAGFSQKILILGYVGLDQAEAAVAADLRCVAYNLENIRALARAARRLKKKAIVHLKIETGTNRQGIPIKSLGIIAKELKKWPEIEVEGISSHFANIEDTTDDFIQISTGQFFGGGPLLRKQWPVHSGQALSLFGRSYSVS